MTHEHLGVVKAVILLAVASPAVAQQQADGYDRTIPVPASHEMAPEPSPDRRLGMSTIDEIIVTAQKKEESLSDVSIAVSAFSGEELQALGITDTRDLGTFIPGFSYAESGYTVPIYSLRGVGFNESSQTASATVGIYVDEANLAFPVFSKGANLDLERVEVLKGPQGTLYGRNTTGGAVNYIARKPTERFEAGISGSYGSYQSVDLETHASGAIAEDWRARAAYRVIDSGKGWQYSLTRGRDGEAGTLGEISKQAGRVILDWRPTDTWTSSLTLSGWTDRSEPQAPQAIGFQPQNPITGRLIGNAALAPEVLNHPLVPFDTDDARLADWPASIPWRLDESFWMAALRSDWQWSDTTTLTLLGSYADFRNDHSLIPQSGLSQINTERDLLVDTQAYSLETRLSGLFSDDIDWMLGGFLSRDSVYEYQTIFIDTNSAAFVVPGLLPILDLGGIPSVSAIVGSPVANRVDTYGDQTANTHAVFANGNWRFLPDFKLNLGMRYTSEERTFSGCSVDSPSSTRGVGFAAAFTGIALARPLTNLGSPIPTRFAQPKSCFTLAPDTNNAGLYTGKLDESNVSGRAALDWTPLADHLYYVSFSRGYKSGSFPIFASSDQGQYEPVTQERLDAIEIGAKIALLDRRLRANFAAYHYDYKDKQLVGRLLDAVFGPLQKLVNAPESRVRGVELELQASPLSGLFVAVSASLIDTEILEYEGLDQSGDPVNLAGKPFNYSPRTEFTVLADYVWPLGDHYNLGIGADYSYTDETNSVLTGDEMFVIDNYFLVNARLSLSAADERWRVTAWGRNVTNEYYSNGSFNTGDTISRYAGMPRTIGISVSYALR